MRYALVLLVGLLAGCGSNTCDIAGKTYQVGEGFPAKDGCNTCTCMKGGTVSCTTMACDVVPAP